MMTSEPTGGPMVVEETFHRARCDCGWRDRVSHADRKQAVRQATIHGSVCPQRPAAPPTVEQINEALAPLGLTIGPGDNGRWYYLVPREGS